MTQPPRSFRGQPLEHAGRIARLDLSPERRAVVGPALEGIYAFIDTLDVIELGDTMPATAFHAQWD